MNQNFTDNDAYASAIHELRHVFVEQLELMAAVGIHPHEQTARQPILISVHAAVPEASHHGGHAAFGHQSGHEIRDINDVVCYEAISDKIIAIVDQGHVDLLEILAENIADALLQAYPISTIRVKIEKPEAIKQAKSVGIEIERRPKRNIKSDPSH